MSRIVPSSAAALCVGAFLAAIAVPAMAQDAVTMVKAEAVVWKPHPVFTGAQIATLVGDPTKPETIVQRFKFPPNFNVSAHTHTYTEVATVLSGSVGLGAGEKLQPGKGEILKAGSVFSLKAGQPHYVWTTNEEAVVQVVFAGPAGIVFTNPADDPRKK
jgi:quercetin dioxygenase-like cupin family protein